MAGKAMNGRRGLAPIWATWWAALGILGFALLSFAIFVREYKSFYAGAGVRALSYAVSEGAFAVRPAGLQSVAREVERCFEALGQAQTSVMAARVKAQAYRSCLGFAEGVLARSPAHGGALQLRAEALLGLLALGADHGSTDQGGGDQGGGDQVGTGTVGAGDVGGDSGLVTPEVVTPGVVTPGVVTPELVVAAQDLAARAAPRTFWLMQRRLLVALSPALSSADTESGAVLSAMVDRDFPQIVALDEGRAWLEQLSLRRPALRAIIARNEGQIGEGQIGEERIGAGDAAKGDAP